MGMLRRHVGAGYYAASDLLFSMTGPSSRYSLDFCRLWSAARAAALLATTCNRFHGTAGRLGGWTSSRPRLYTAPVTGGTETVCRRSGNRVNGPGICGHDRVSLGRGSARKGLCKVDRFLTATSGRSSWRRIREISWFLDGGKQNVVPIGLLSDNRQPAACDRGLIAFRLR